MSQQLRLAMIIDAVDNATGKLRAVNQAIDKANEPMRRLRASTKELLREGGWNKLQGQLGTINERARTLGGTIRGYAAGFAALTVAAGGAFFAIKRTVDQVDHANDVARMLGVSVETVQRMGFALQLSGGQAEDMSGALSHLSRSMVEAITGSKEAQLWFTRVGIPLEKLRQMKAPQVLEAIADKFKSVGDMGLNAEKKLALLAALTGRSSLKLKQMLDGGSQGMRELYAEADRLGAVIDGKTADAMADFNDDFDRLKTSIFGVATQIAKAALPALDAMVKKFTELNVANRVEIGKRIGEMIGKLVPMLPGFLTSLGQIVGTIGSMLVAVDKIVESLGGWEVVLKALAALLAVKLIVQFSLFVASIISAIPTVISLTRVVWGLVAGLAATPLGWIGLLVAGATAVWAAWNPIKSFFADLWAGVVRLVEKLGSVFGIGSSSGGASGGWEQPTAGAPVPSAIATRGGPFREGMGGTLRITVDSEGRARVRDLTKKPGSALDFDVYTGTALGLQ